MMVLMSFQVDGWRRAGQLSRPDDKGAAVGESLRNNSRLFGMVGGGLNVAALFVGLVRRIGCLHNVGRVLQYLYGSLLLSHEKLSLLCCPAGFILL